MIALRNAIGGFNKAIDIKQMEFYGMLIYIRHHLNVKWLANASNKTHYCDLENVSTGKQELTLSFYNWTANRLCEWLWFPLATNAGTVFVSGRAWLARHFILQNKCLAIDRLFQWFVHWACLDPWYFTASSYCIVILPGRPWLNSIAGVVLLKHVDQRQYTQ